MRYLKFAVLICVLGFGFGADAADGTSRILIPTLYQGPGAFGTQWSTEALVTNLMIEPMVIPDGQFIRSCQIPEGCYSDFILPNEAGLINMPRNTNGLLLYAPAGQARDFLITLRTAAAPRRLETQGTELPVALEADFTTLPLRLQYVPVSPDSVRSHRATLRIYGVDAIAGTRVRIDFRSWFSPEAPPRITMTLTLDVPPSPPAATRPLFPAFGQLDLTNGVATSAGQRTFYTVHITPLRLPDGTIPKIWAFVSITDNETSEVTIIRAQ